MFVPPDDTEAIFSAINTLIADSPRRHYLADKARDRALEFRKERMASGYLAAYQELYHFPLILLHIIHG